MLAVGDSTRLEIIFSTGGYTSRVTKSPTIETNEGSMVVAKKVRVMANIVSEPESTSPVVLKPFKLEFSTPSDATPVQLRFTIANISSHSLTPKVISAPNALLSVSLPEAIPPGGSRQAVVMVKQSSLKDVFEKSITLEFDDKAKTRYTVPIVYRFPEAILSGKAKS